MIEIRKIAITALLLGIYRSLRHVANDVFLGLFPCPKTPNFGVRQVFVFWRRKGEVINS